MCKKSLLMMLLMALLVPWAAKAQSVPYEVQIGEGTSTSGYFPFYTLYEYSIGENLFLASELEEAGVLPGQVTSLSWYATNAPGYEQQGISIWMANVSDEALTTTSHVTTDMTLVYTGSVTPAVGWNEFMCEENTFTWDGTSNILIFCQRNNGDWNSTVNWQATTGLDFNAMSYRYQDGSAYDVTIPNTMYTSTTRPNIIIKGVGGGGGGPTCAKPTGLAISYTGGNTAQVSWNSEATAWNIDVNGTVTAITTNPYTLTGLEMATTYTVKVQANCGGGDLSDWSSAKSFTTDLCMPENMCEISYQLNDSYGDGWNGNAINVTDVLTGNTITQLTMTSGSSASGSFAVCDGRQIQFSWVTGNYAYETSYTVTDANGTVIFSGSGALTEPVNYTVDCPSCITPKNFTVSDITTHGATLDWVSAAEAWQIDCNGAITDVTEKPITLTLEPDTEYTVKVRAYCGGEDYSEWTSAQTFSTLPTCYAPTDMVISDITAYTANVAWTSENTNIEMRYCPDVRPITTFDDSQMHGWTNIDADGDGYEWVLGSACGGIYLAAGSSLAGSGHNGSADLVTSGSFSNVSGVGALTPDNYLVSPQITLGGSISFWACAQDAGYAAEHFGVAVSTTGNTDPADFTTIAEWTFGSRSANVLRSSNAPRGGNRAQAEWVQYTVDLSAYSGQGYVAIRHFDCTDQFMLNVDDIFIEEPGFELPWVYVTNPASPQALTNLEPETTYLVQVRANCGEENGYSKWLEGTFTTLPACMVPTGLVVSNIDKRSADIAWVSNGDEEAWQICVNGDEENLIYVTDTTYSFTGLEPETRYTVKVRAYCDETLQSAWSSPATFTTLVACPAPTGLAISDITNVSAVASWTGEGDFELQYGADPWKHYDDGTHTDGIGTGGGSDVYWAIMLPPTMLSDEPLTKVSVYEASGYNTEPMTIMVYTGGDDAPATLLYQEEVTTLAADDFHEITLGQPVTFDATQNLWIVCKEYGTYPAQGSTDTGDPNGRWISLDGTSWVDVASYGLNYTWMIRAAFGNASTEWVTVDNATSPQAITGLTPETNYFVRVKHICGGIDGESVWTSTMFTTDVACPAPEALGATPYALSAELSWEGISESYTVSYRLPESMNNNGINEGFELGTMPAGWTIEGSGTWTVGTGDYSTSTGAHSGTYNAKINHGTTGNETYLVTPNLDLSGQSDLNVNLWYINRSWSGDTDGFGVYYRVDGGDWNEIFATTDAHSAWTELNEALPAGAYAANCQIGFKFTDAYGYGVAIDDITIGTPSVIPAGEWMTVTVDEATATITGLTPATTYEWKVQGNCGEYGMSEESEIASFTTTADACPVPTNLTVVDSLTTATTADLRWNGSPDVESFTVRYRVPEHAAAGSFYETFDNTSVPTGWTRYSGLVDDVVAGSATLTSTTSGWNFSNTNVFGAYHAKVNIYGTSCKYWLVTPEVTPTNGNLSFDLALTGYNSANAASGTCDDDRFVVLVYADSTWTILREWNNSGSSYVYNNIATTGEAVSIDLSAYVGQAVQIAFYGESTVTNNGDNDLHIDNVLIGTLIPATDWQTVTTTETNVTLTGLTPETTYEAQVKADCSDPEAWSNTATFTTLEQTTLTQTIALSTGVNWVSFYIDITLDDLKEALAAVTPNSSITIKGKNTNTVYVPRTHKWNGTLDWDVNQMYKIIITTDCEIALEGMLLDPAEHPITITNGVNWIGFPLNVSMTPTNAFAGFAVNGDIIKSKDNNSVYSRNKWSNGVSSLVPGQGYIYNSATTNDRTLVFPASAK